MYWRITCLDRKEQYKLLILKVLSKSNQHITTDYSFILELKPKRRWNQFLKKYQSLSKEDLQMIIWYLYGI